MTWREMLNTARDPATSAEKLKELSNCRRGVWDDVASMLIRKAVAGNLRTPPKVLHDLAFDGASDVREAVARNANTLGVALRKLSSDNVFRVREAVAENSNTLPTDLEHLSFDQCLREKVARNPSTSAEVLTRLSTSYKKDEALVTLAVVGNPSTPTAVLKKLMKCTEAPEVAEKAAEVVFKRDFPDLFDEKRQIALERNLGERL